MVEKPISEKGIHLFLHPRVNHLVTALDTFWPALQSPVGPLCDDNLDVLLGFTVRHALFHELLDLLRLCTFRQVRSILNTLSLLHRLLQSLCGLELLTSLRLGNFLDWASVQSTLAGSEGGYRLLRYGYVGFVVFALVVEEPRR